MQRSSIGQHGFSLLEMAVVLVIISVVLGVVMAGGVGSKRPAITLYRDRPVSVRI